MYLKAEIKKLRLFRRRLVGEVIGHIIRECAVRIIHTKESTNGLCSHQKKNV